MKSKNIIGIAALGLVGLAILATTACAPKSRFRGPVTLNPGKTVTELNILMTDDQYKEKLEQEVKKATATPEKAAASTALSNKITVAEYNATGTYVTASLRIKTEGSQDLLLDIGKTEAETMEFEKTDKEKLKAIGLENFKANIACKVQDCSTAFITLSNGDASVILDISQYNIEKMNASSADEGQKAFVKAINEKLINVQITDITNANPQTPEAYNILKLSTKNEGLEESQLQDALIGESSLIGKLAMGETFIENKIREDLRVNGFKLVSATVLALDIESKVKTAVLQLNTSDNQTVALSLGEDLPLVPTAGDTQSGNGEVTQTEQDQKQQTLEVNGNKIPVIKE